MINLGKAAYRIFLLVLGLVVLAYAVFFLVLPRVINSDWFISKLTDIVYEKTDIRLDAGSIEFKPYRDFSSELIMKGISVSQDGEKFAGVDNAYADFRGFSLIPRNIKADYVFFDKTKFKGLAKKTTGKKEIELNVKHLPALSFKKCDIIIPENENETIKIAAENISMFPDGNKFFISLNAGIGMKSLNNDIILGNSGYLYIDNNALYADKFEVGFGDSKLNVSGKILDGEKTYDIAVIGKDLSVNSLEKDFLFMMKLKNKQKNFIENFYDFSGTADIGLKVTNSGIYGDALVKNLSAKTVKFNIPILLPAVDFKFEGDSAGAAASGKFGNEDVYTDVSITGLLTPERLVKGSVKAALTKKFTDKYTPGYSIKSQVPVVVEYNIQNKIVNVKYLADLPAGSNLYYGDADLGFTTRNRRVFAETEKIGSKLYLKNYDYSYVEGKNVENILLGDGLFVKKNGHLTPAYITGHTNGEAPVSVAGSFGRYVDGGTFRGNLKYDFQNTLLTGEFILKNSRHKDFYVEKAYIKADKDNLKIGAEGTYKDSPFESYVDMENSFDKKITINDMYLYLKRYVVQRNAVKSEPNMKISGEAKELEWQVKNYDLAVDEISYKDVVLKTIKLKGNFNNGIVEFTMPGTGFAGGDLAANGIYDTAARSSDVHFSAANIDSNLAAGMLFGLVDQFEGSANAGMHVKTSNVLQNVNAAADFSIENGAMTKIGSTEFIIKKNKKIKKNLKFKLTDITNVDIDKMEALRSNIKGSFDLYNTRIENVCIFSKHKYLSLFTEGDYNVKDVHADITVWGKYNKNAQKNIRILFVPLSWITKIVLRPEHTKNMYQDKLDEIPPIEAGKKDVVNFAVHMNGNLNDNSSIKVKLKRIE